VLAEDIISEVNIPEANRAVSDGYAVRAEDTKDASLTNPTKLKVLGETFPGEAPLEITPGQAVYVACGAPVPKGADAVVMVENTRLLRDEIEIYFPLKTGENIALAGEDVRDGSLVFKRGHVLRPQDVGLLAGIGRTFVKVRRKPKVGIISVGNELIKLSKEEPSRIANNYALIFSGLVSELGATPILIGIIPDDMVEIREKISEVLEETDLVVTIGGCSVGQRDFVPEAIDSLGEPGLVFHGVKLSPGKVTGAGIIHNKPVIMLPGHIVSAYAGFYLFLAPLIAKLLGISQDALFPAIKAKMVDRVKARPTASFLRIRLSSIDGESLAKPILGGSSVLTTLTDSNGYAIVPEGKGIEKGETVNVTLYSKHEFAHLMPLKRGVPE